MNFTEFVNLLSSKPSEGRIFNPYGGEDLQSMSLHRPSVTPQQLIQPYYGDQYRKEVIKARNYNEQNNLPTDLGRLEQPVSLETQNPTTKLPVTVKDSFFIGPPVPDMLPTVYIPTPHQTAVAMTRGEDLGDERTNYQSNRPIDTTKSVENFEQAYMQLAEHLVGQNITRNEVPTSQTIFVSSPVVPEEFEDLRSGEMGSNLSMLTREHFKKTGQRLAPESVQDLLDNQTKWKDYSDFSQRALKVLHHARENKLPDYQNWLQILPGLVKTESPTARAIFA